MDIREDLAGQEIADFLREHLDYMYEISPPGTVQALDLDELRAPEVTFWTLRDDDDLLGCCALKEINASTGKIKSMRTAPKHRGQGVASRLSNTSSWRHGIGEWIACFSRPARPRAFVQTAGSTNATASRSRGLLGATGSILTAFS